MAQENHKDLIGLVKEASRTEDDGDGMEDSVHAFLEVSGVWPHTSVGASSRWRHAQKQTRLFARHKPAFITQL